jgi:hypothetical protein
VLAVDTPLLLLPPFFRGFPVAQSLVFYVVFRRPYLFVCLFVIFLLGIALSVLRSTTSKSGYHLFGERLIVV